MDGLRPRQEAPQDGLPRPRHRRAVVQRRLRARGEPHRRQGGPGLHPADDEPPARAPLDRRRRGGRRRGGARVDASTTRKSREAFGERIIDFQNTRFKLADVATTVDVLWAYVDRAMLAVQGREAHGRGGREGQVLDDRARVGAARHLRAAARRIRLHHRVPDRPRLPGRPRAPHLRRHERDHARHRRAVRSPASASGLEHAVPDAATLPLRGVRVAASSYPMSSGSSTGVVQWTAAG